MESLRCRLVVPGWSRVEDGQKEPSLAHVAVGFDPRHLKMRKKTHTHAHTRTHHSVVSARQADCIKHLGASTRSARGPRRLQLRLTVSDSCTHGRRSREGRTLGTCLPRIWSEGDANANCTPQILSCFKISSTRLLALQCSKLYCL